jgi:septal ring factor EnvC (AmiA/AmiB activator)
LVGLLAGANAAAQSRTDLEKLETEIESTKGREAELGTASKALASELRRLRQQSIAAAWSAQESEAELTRLERKLRKTKAAARARKRALKKQRRQMAGTLSALAQLSRNPPRALLLSPKRPIEVVRQAMLLRATLPVLQNRAKDLRAKLAALAETRKSAARQRDRLASAQREHKTRTRRLDKLIARQTLLLKRTETERQRVAGRLEKLAREARDLKELFARLEEERARARQVPERPGSASPIPPGGQAAGSNVIAALPKPDILRRFPDEGTITLPARGRIARQYGESTGFGNTAKGITIETRSVAQIVAPFDGRIVFSGPFRGYGQILIIEHDGGYHTLLAGLDRIDGHFGQWVLAGEPIGVMADAEPGGSKFYFELRRRGQSINPLPWFAEYRKKFSG